MPKKPRAILTPQYDATDGSLTHIVNTSKWNDKPNTPSAARQTEWMIVKNGRVLTTFSLLPNPRPVPLSVNSSGESLVLPDGATTVFDYLTLHGFSYTGRDLIQVYIKVVNGKKVKSGWSNPITLPQQMSCPMGYKSFRGKGYVSFRGKCYVPFAQKPV